MDLLGCGVCKSPGHNRSANAAELEAFWSAKGVDGAAPDGMEVRSVLVCFKGLNLPRRELCGCVTAWVRESADTPWRYIVQIPSDFVSTAADARSA